MQDLHCVPTTYLSILKDWVDEYPEHQDILTNHLTWLIKYIQGKGFESLLYTTFPKLGKAFDKGLSEGFYNPIDVPVGQKVYESSGISSLLSLFFERDYNGYRKKEGFLLLPEIDHRLVFLMRTLLYSHKKVEVPIDQTTVKSQFADFANLDKEVVNGYSNFTELDSSLSGLQEVCNLLIPRKEFLLQDFAPRHGPGATCDTSRNRDKYHLLHSWPDRLDAVFPYCEYGTHRPRFNRLVKSTNKYEGFTVVHRERFNRETSCRLSAVPKTVGISRIITVEPTSMQFCQQGMLTWLRKELHPVLRQCIHFNSQEYSKNAALSASLDGKRVTIDLKSASDLLSVDAVRAMLSKNSSLLTALLACRSETVDTGEQVIRLEKYAGQGNATTFPIQSMLYACVCIWSILKSSGKKITISNCRKAAKDVVVFGDDIILPKEPILHLSHALKLLGLRINLDKSHIHGNFREACGMDAFEGSEVTPLYFHHTKFEYKPGTISSWIDVSNNAYRMGLWRTASWMMEQVPPSWQYSRTNGNTGFFSYCGTFNPPSFKTRWNKHLQYEEHLLPTIVVERKMSESVDPFGRLYKYFVENPSQHVIWEGRLTERSRIKTKMRWVRME